MVATNLKREFYRKWVAEEKGGVEFTDGFNYKFLEG
jgi:hypothetical protein